MFRRRRMCSKCGKALIDGKNGICLVCRLKADLERCGEERRHLRNLLRKTPPKV